MQTLRLIHVNIAQRDLVLLLTFTYHSEYLSPKYVIRLLEPLLSVIVEFLQHQDTRFDLDFPESSVWFPAKGVWVLVSLERSIVTA